MTAKLHWSKTGKGKNALYTLEGFEGILKREDLPKEYLAGRPCFYANSDVIKERCTMNEESFREIITVMKAAGRRLTEINKKLREPVKFTVEI